MKIGLDYQNVLHTGKMLQGLGLMGYTETCSNWDCHDNKLEIFVECYCSVVCQLTVYGFIDHSKSIFKLKSMLFCNSL